MSQSLLCLPTHKSLGTMEAIQGLVSYMSPIEVFVTGFKIFDGQKVRLIAWFSMDQRSHCSCVFLSLRFHSSEVILIPWLALKKGFDHGRYKWLPLAIAIIFYISLKYRLAKLNLGAPPGVSWNLQNQAAYNVLLHGQKAHEHSNSTSSSTLIQNLLQKTVYSPVQSIIQFIVQSRVLQATSIYFLQSFGGQRNPV